MKLKIKSGSEGQVSLNLRDYQIDICSRVRVAFEKHRSVMMQMPTGTGKTVVLAEMVRQYLNSYAVGHCNSYGGRVLIVAHRIELIEQTGEHLERYDIDYGVIAGGKKVKEIKPVMIASIQTLSSKLNALTACLSPSFIIIDEAHHAVAQTYRQLWDTWPEARFLGLTATPYRLSGEGFTDLFDVLVDSWTVKRFIAEGWLSAFDYYSIRPESDEQKLIDNLKKRGADGDFQMKELHETLDIAPCIERLFESFERFAYDKKGIVYAIDIAHAEHIAEFFRGKGVAAYAISSKTPLPERKLLIEGFRKSVFGEEKASSLENHNPTPSIFENSPVPSYPEEGLHRFPLNPLSPQGTGDLKPGRLGLYEQTSSRPQGVARELPTQQSCECLTQYNCECLTQQSCDFERKASSVEKHTSSDSIFENSPVPSYPEEGLHLSLLNPLPPQEGKDLKPGRLGLYEQTSSRPQGVARELLTQQSCDCLTQQSCECLCAKGAAAHTGAAARSGAEGHSIQILVSVDLFSEGFDCPDVEFIQLARPTLSLAKYLQMVGRGLRVHEGKVCCTIIDNVGLYRRFGLPSGERNWEVYFGGLKDERMKELNNLDFDLNHNSGSFRKEGDAALVKIVGHEGMASRFERLGRAGFERKKKDVLLSGKRKKVWVWVDTLTGITFERNPVAVDFKGVEMMTDDGLTFYPRIRSKWVDGKCGINRKALETQVGDGFGWMKRYVSLHEPDKVYELQEVMDNGMRVYKDEESKTYFQQDLDCPLVSEEEAGGKNAFMALCDKRLEEWKTKVLKRRRNGFLHADVTTGEWSLYGKQVEKDGEFFRIVASESIGGECQQSAEGERWFDGNTGFVYHHRPVVRYRGFVKLVYDGDLVYIMNIHEERFIAYHNWEIRADDGICTIGNKLYLKRNKDGKALWIMKRSGDFQMFVVNEPMMVEDSQKRPLTIDVQMMIINKYGKEIEKKRIKEQDTKTKQFGV